MRCGIQSGGHFRPTCLCIHPLRLSWRVRVHACRCTRHQCLRRYRSRHKSTTVAESTMSFDFDLFVIGAGSGGVRAARFAAGFGARVAVAESRYLGGTCVNVGCVPKKMLVYGAHYSEDLEQAHAYGWTAGAPTFDWPTLIAHKNT